MDFDSREVLWTHFITKLDESITPSLQTCKICIALEILKLASCAENCSNCETNLFSIIFKEIPAETLAPHLNTIKLNVTTHQKLEELEQKIPCVDFIQIIEKLDSKANFLTSELEKLNKENRKMKEKLLFAQACALEYKEKYENFLEEAENILKNQQKIQGFVQEIGENIFFNRELLFEIQNSIDLNKKVEKLDNLIIEEYSTIDELWNQIQKLIKIQDSIENKQDEVKKYAKHCRNLDKATETILEYHHEMIFLQKNIDLQLNEIAKELKSEETIEFMNFKYRKFMAENREQILKNLNSPN